MTEPRSIELSVEVPGTPEEVWEAIATGPGITSWFIPMEVEERVGGTVTMDFGSYGTEQATVTAWEPPHRVVFEGGGEHPLAYEWLVEARDGGSCVVRLVNSGFGHGEEWDGQYDGMSEGWRIFLQNLRLQLTHFPGRTTAAERAREATTIPSAMARGPRRDAWRSLCAALGIAPDLGPGDEMRTGGGAPVLVGTVATTMDSDMATAYLLVLSEPAPGTGFIAAEGEGDHVALSVYLYRYGEDAGDDGWSTFLAEAFPPSEAELST